MKKYNVAVVGATGNVGREILNILDDRNFPINKIYAVASSRSEGLKIPYGNGKELEVQSLDTFKFKETELVLSSPGSKISAKFVPKATKDGAIVIDNTSHFRMKKGIPLIVPEVNPKDIFDLKKKIVSNPNCSTIQMVVALKPLHDAFHVRRVVVATYQSVSGSGKSAMDELFEQTRNIYVNAEIKKEHFTKQIAFNAIPHIDAFLDDGSTKEEWKMAAETKKIIDPDIKVIASCVRVPIFVGHGEAVNVEFDNDISEVEARDVLRKAPGVLVVDDREDGGYVTPLESAGEDAVYVSRLRDDPTVENGLAFWLVADNLRKGAALNTVQIAEVLINRFL